MAFSLESGAYAEKTIDLILENPAGLPVVYTIDGSTPNSASQRVDGTLTIDSSDTNSELIDRLNQEIPDFRTILVDESLPTATVIRAATLLPDDTVGPVFTNTYFVGEDLQALFGNIMVISLVTDPANLFDYNTGIMAMGALYDEHRSENERLTEDNMYNVQANYSQKGRDWEREATMEFFDGSNELSFEAPCGIRLRGHISRIFAQKSFNVYFRDSYGMKLMNYALFGNSATDENDSPITTYKSFCLRAGGNDTESLRFRDSLLHEQMKHSTFATQATRPAIVFLNGEFYGVFSLNEKYSDSYAKSHYGVASDNVVIFEDGELDEEKDEDGKLWGQLMVNTALDLSDDATWNAFCDIFDLRSFVDHYAMQLYIGNYDFHDFHNARFWRVRDADPSSTYGDKKWRVMAFDLEYSMGLIEYAGTSPDYDIVGQYLSTSSLFASAMHNPSFRAMVRERLVDLSKTTFEPSHINAVFDEWWSTWKPWIMMSCKRFSTNPESPQLNVDSAKDFFSQRAQHILGYFDEHAAALAAEN